jgi:hypothetical protein
MRNMGGSSADVDLSSCFGVPASGLEWIPRRLSAKAAARPEKVQQAEDLECGAVPPLLFFCVGRQHGKRKKNKSGGTAPHSKIGLSG